MVLLDCISKNYNDKDNIVKAVSNVSIHFESGKFYSIVGPSGSGKSTLLKIIGGLIKPTSGKVFFDDIDLYELTDKKLANFRNKKIGFVFQSFFLEPSFTVIENVELPLLISGISKSVRLDKVMELLDSLGLKDKAFEKVCNLSGGESQRVSIARALVNNADYIIADEPTGSLDSKNSKIVLDILKELSKQGKTIVLVTHNEEDAINYSDHIYRIKDGII